MPQAFLGEIALLYNCERTASITNGAEVASVLTLRAEHFQRMLTRVPDMREQIEQTQRARMIFSFMVLSGLFPKDATEEKTHAQCEQIAKRVSVRSVPKGTVLCEGVGSQNSEFVMLYQGSLSRMRQDSKSPDGGTGSAMDEELLKPGGYAGGVAMLRSDGTTERIVTETACLLLVAPGNDFFGMLLEVPALYGELLLRSYGSKAPLEAFLSCPKALTLWYEHQKEEFSSETTEFWMATDAFVAAAKTGAKATDLKAQAQTILEEYINDGCEKQVNLPGPLQKAVVASVGSDVVGQDAFDAARKEIYNLMRRDTLPRFIHSERLPAILSSLGEPLPIPESEPPASIEAAQNAYAASQNGGNGASQTGGNGASRADGENYSPNYNAR